MNMPYPDVRTGLLPNGDMRVEYKSGRFAALVDVVPEHFASVYETMLKQNPSERVYTLRSVRAAIKEFSKSLSPSTEQSQNLCDDVGIWFVGEVLAGREENPWPEAAKPLVMKP